MIIKYNPNPETNEDELMNELWARRINDDEYRQLEIEVANRLEQLALKIGLYYTPPRHDSKCPICMTSRALTALEVYFSQDPVEVLIAEAEKGYDLTKLVSRRNKLQPGLAKSVIYRSRTGDYDCAAIIAATRSSLNIKNVEKGFLPPISVETNVHLIVFSAGRTGQGRTIMDAEKDFLVKSEHGVSVNIGGTYQEWDIPYDPDGGPGTWRWPE